MNLPIWRQRHHKPDIHHEPDRLHRSLAEDLERWPDFASELIDSVRDVVPLADLEDTETATCWTWSCRVCVALT